MLRSTKIRMILSERRSKLKMVLKATLSILSTLLMTKNLLINFKAQKRLIFKLNIRMFKLGWILIQMLKLANMKDNKKILKMHSTQ